MRVQVRVDRLLAGNPGDVAPIGGGLSELRIHYGPGYRVYFWESQDSLVLLLLGGPKSRQVRDIRAAHALMKEWNDLDH